MISVRMSYRQAVLTFALLITVYSVFKKDINEVFIF